MAEEASLRERARNSPEYAKLKQQLGNRDWRIDNLYWIKDKEGEEIPFRRNRAQMTYSGQQWHRDNILKSRQLGFSTLIALIILDACLFTRNTMAGIIDQTLDDAEAKLDKLRFAYSKLPSSIRTKVALTRDNDSEMVFSNGSVVTVGTSYRGGTLQMLHVSEYGKISAKKPDVAREIRTGAIQSVAKTGKIWVESTAEGNAGEFYELCERSRKLQLEKKPLTPLDFRFHFHPWWSEPEYRLQVNLVVIPTEVYRYFDEIEEKWGIKLDGQQKAWYAKMRDEVGHDDIFREYPSTPEEPFFVSNVGAYFRHEMTKVRLDGRICHVPHDPSRPVNTWWDIGVDDETAIWFHQTDGLRHWFIDYYEVSQEGLSHCLKVLADKRDAKHYLYGKHYGPHDLEVREWANPQLQTRAQIAASQGFKFEVVPRIENKADSIEAGRRFLSMCWFDEENCQRGIACLDNYQKTWNKSLSIYTGEPLKNGFDHGADAFQTGARGVRPDLEERRAERLSRSAPREKKFSQWGS